MFECPGCACAHSVRIAAAPGSTAAVWQFNGDMAAPTFSPSYHVQTPGHQCHSHIRNGRIGFLEDCDHGLAGQTVELPEWEN